MTRYRVGNGFDAHRLVAGRPLVLGGVTCRTTAASRATPTATACCTRCATRCSARRAQATWASTSRAATRAGRAPSSLVFLDEVARILVRAGWALENVDVTVVAQAPALAPHAEAMRTAIARALEAPIEAVSVKAKSTDGLGALGRGEGIAAQATALLRRDG